ncbi:uncharacterized protein [Ptychodera flava]|uniref:uncharacterized protein isoform X5 n=1 Tax=Ptychodera flava TaxID=63121 RepID=UPI00396AA700
MDGGEEQEIPKAREMGQQTCHVLQNTDVHRQRLLIAFENLKPPDDPSKSSQEICGWLPDTKVQYRKVDKGKQNNSGRPVSGKKARQINPREHFQFIHYSDPRKYIEQYRRLHTCGGPLEKLRQGHCGREKEIYYAPFEHQHGTTINVNSKNLQGHCSKCMRLEPPSTLQTKFPLNYYLPYSPRETNITFEIQARPSVSQYKAVYNTNTGITYEANDHAQAQNSGSGGSSSRESSAETPEKYSFHNGSVVALPRPRLYVATSTTTPTTTNNSTTMSNSRSTSRQSPPQNGFSIDRSLGKVTSTTGHTQTEYDRASYDMTATGYNIMTVDRKTFLEHLEKYTYQQQCMRAVDEDPSDTLRPPSRFTPVPLVRPCSIKKVLPQPTDSLSRSQQLEILRVAQGRSKALRLEDPNPYDMWAADRQKVEERARDRQESKARRYRKTLVPDVRV